MNDYCKKCCEKLRTCLSKLAPWAPVFCRLTLGIVFLQTGWGKLHDLDKITAYFTELGIPFPHIQAPFVASVEFLSGIALLLGIVPRLASLMIIGIMCVAIITAKRADIGGVLDLFGIQEWDYIVMALVVLCAGAGPLSLSKYCCKKCCKK